MAQFAERKNPPDVPGALQIDEAARDWLQSWTGSLGLDGAGLRHRSGEAKTGASFVLELLPDPHGASGAAATGATPAHEGPLRVTFEEEEILRLSGDLYERPSRDRSGRVGDLAEPPWFARSAYRVYLRGVEIRGRDTVFNCFRWQDSVWVVCSDLVLTQTSVPPSTESFRDTTAALRGDYMHGAERGTFCLAWTGSVLRRALVEIDKVTAVAWPDAPDPARTIESAFRAASWRVEVEHNCSSIADPPHGELATDEFLNEAADRFRKKLPDTAWHYYVQCHRGLAAAPDGFGRLLSDGGSATEPARQDVVVAAHTRLPPPLSGRLQDQPLLYLRTVVHELGRAVGFDRSPASGCTFMRDTRQLVSACKTAEWSFTEEQILLLQHRPDAWIRPHFQMTSAKVPLPTKLGKCLRGLVVRLRKRWRKLKRFVTRASR
ncbi:MAG: hypothetical protein AAGC60_09170 [Acidobacteriota bacterium]